MRYRQARAAVLTQADVHVLESPRVRERSREADRTEGDDLAGVRQIGLGHRVGARYHISPVESDRSGLHLIRVRRTRDAPEGSEDVMSYSDAASRGSGMSDGERTSVFHSWEHEPHTMTSTTTSRRPGTVETRRARPKPCPHAGHLRSRSMVRLPEG